MNNSPPPSPPQEDREPTRAKLDDEAAMMLRSIIAMMNEFDSRLGSIDSRLRNLESPDEKSEREELSEKTESSKRGNDRDSDNQELPLEFDNLHGDHDESLSNENPMKARERSSRQAREASAPKIPDRRSTMFERQALDAALNAQAMVFQAKQPDYGHIKLGTLKAHEIFLFFEELEEYQSSYQIKLQAPMLLSPSLRNKIITKYSLTITKYNRLTDTQLYDCVRSFILPTSKSEFFDTLAESIEFKIRSSYRPTPERFRTFYDELLAYRNLFSKTFELLATDNKHNIPECKFSKGGLIKCFTDKIPFEYGSRLIQELPKAEIEKSVYVFLKEFYIRVEEHLDCHEKARHLSRFFGGTAYELTKKTEKTLSNIEGTDEAFQDVYDDTDEPEVPPPDPVRDSLSPDDDDEEAGFDDELAAMQVPSHSRSSPGATTGPCFRKVNTGHCDKPGCAFSHNADVIRKARESKLAELRKLQEPVQPKVGVYQHRKN